MLYFIFAFLAFFLLDSGAANAGPLVAAIVAIGNVLGGLGIVGKILLTVGLAIGQTMLQKALAKKNKPQDQIQGADLEIKMGDDQPVSTTLGRYVTAGKRKYIGAWGKVNKTPNAFLVDVIELGNLPVGALVELWINDKKVTLDTSSPHPDGLGYPMAEFMDDGKQYGWWKFYDGSQTVADPYLLAKFGSHADRPWLSTMIGRGCPYIILTYRLNQKLYSNSLPSAAVVTEGTKLYDIRKDSTEGGSGAHRWNDQSTWEPSDNPFVQAYNVARGLSYNGKWFFGGQNVTTKRLPRSAWTAAMNACDLLRTLEGGGTEKMYRSGIELKGENEPLAIIEYLRGAANGRIVEIGGKLKPFAGELGAAEAAFTDGDIIITEGQNFEPFPNLDDIVNGATATYPEPVEKWASKDAPPYYVPDLEVEDGARRLVAALQFPAAPYPVQVQALMRTAVEEARRFRTHQIWLPPAYWALEPGDVVTWSSTINGYSNKKFLVLSVEGELTYNQLVTLREVDPADYSWSPTFELPVIVGPVGPDVLPTQTILGWSVTASSMHDDSGTQRRPAVTIAVDQEIDDLRAVKIEIQHDISGEVVHTVELPYVVETKFEWQLTGSFLLPGEDYNVRGIQVPIGTARNVDWTAWTNVTMFPIGLASKDILDDAITAAKIQDAAITADKIMNDAITSIKLANEAVTTAKIALAAVTADILANNAVIASKIADGAINTAKFAAGIEPVSINTDPTLPTVKTTTNIVWEDQLYTWNGTAYVKPEAEIGPGSITSTEIADNSITTPKLVANAVTADKVAANAIVAGKIAAGAVSAAEIAAGSILASKLVLADTSNVFPDFNMLDNSFYTPGSGVVWALSGTSTGYSGSRQMSIEPHATVSQDVRSGYFTLNQSADYYFEGVCRVSTNPAIRLDLYDIDASGAFVYTRTVALISGPVSGKQSSSFTTTSSEKAGRLVFRNVAGATGTAWFSAPIIRRKAMGELIVDGAIIAEKLAAGSVIAGKIAAGAVTATELASNSVTAVKIAAGTITGDKIAANTIAGDRIVANAITARELILVDYSNLFVDFDFEAQDQYSGYPSPVSFSGTSTVNCGRNAMIIDPADGVDYSSYSPYARIEPGADFYAEMAAWTETGDATNRAIGYVALYSMDSAGAYTLLRTLTVVDKTNDGSSAKEGLAFTTASNERAYRVRFRRFAGTGRGFFGGVVIRRKANANLIVDGSIIAAKLAANSVIAGKIAADAVTATTIATGAVTADAIAASAITAGKISAGAINTSSLIVDGVVITAKIADNAVTQAAGAYTAGTATGTGTMQSVSVSNPGGDPVIINANVNLEGICTVTGSPNSSDERGIVTITLNRSGSGLRSAELIVDVPESGTSTGDKFSAGGSISVDFYDSAPGAGTNSYTISLSRTTTGAGISLATNCSDRFLSALVIKK